MPKPYFPNIKKITFDGPDSKNPLAFKHYNPKEKILGKSMADHLRFAVCYWHTFKGLGADPFGPGAGIDDRLLRRVLDDVLEVEEAPKKAESPATPG
jgi:xylose isomerase